MFTTYQFVPQIKRDCKKVKKMALQKGEPSKELIDSQAHIWNHIFSFINSMSLKCAVQLQIPDIINRHGSPMLLSELVKALGINRERTPFVYRLMRILVHSGFFVKQSVLTTPGGNDEEGEGYFLAPSSRLLLKDEPLSLRPFLLAMLDPMLMDPWQHLSKWFQNDDVNPVQTTYGRILWDLAGQEKNLNQFFNEAMASDARLVTSVVLEHCGGVFEGLDSIVDVGGGTGTFAKGIAKAFPNISCTSFDLPHVVDGLVGSKNLSYVGGDMFEAIPKADALLLKWILHDWSDEKCVKILKQCKEAIPSKENRGKLIIIDMFVKVHEGENDLLETQLFFDMLLMTLLEGRERSEEDWAKLFLDADFSDYKIVGIIVIGNPGSFGTDGVVTALTIVFKQPTIITVHHYESNKTNL
ncbi:putative O-methyltransferase domain, plant methyltransferase dimerization [Helianthus annuus]|nr:putative O-methyltransferase domain, plant methyltransferase dimerization [Helianthus annuus]